MTALLWASYRGHLSVVRELVNVYKMDLFQKDEVHLTLSHALVTMHNVILCHKVTCMHKHVVYIQHSAHRHHLL